MQMIQQLLQIPPFHNHLGALLSAVLVDAQRVLLLRLGLGRQARQAETQHRGVLERHAGAAGEVGQRGVHGIAEEREGA
jgi:hypothetical protein